MTPENINGANIVRALEVANALRAEFGEDKIDDLPAGRKREAGHCTLARAFNFDCLVSVTWQKISPVWFVRVKDWDHARKLGDLLATEPVQVTSHAWRVYLPEDIARVARLFDNGHLPERYYERASV